MDDNQAAAQSAAAKEHRAGLAKNSLNLPRLAFIGLAYFSLAPVIYLSIVWFSLAWAVIGIFWALWWARRRHLASISLSAEV